jgi:hypothetical protein
VSVSRGLPGDLFEDTRFMAMKSSMVVLTASLLALPMAGAWAQTTDSTTKGSSTSMSSHAAMDKNPHVKGATGSTIVKGDRSTIAGDKGGTAEQKTGQLSK